MAKSKEQKRQEAAARRISHDASLIDALNSDRGCKKDAATVCSEKPGSPDFLLRTPQYVMRAHINRPLKEFRGMKLSQAVETDGMGNSYFEGGAMPRSLRALQENATKLRLHGHPSLVDKQGRTLFMLHFLQGDDVAEYDGYVSRLRGDGPRLHTPERTNFEKDATQSKIFLVDLWWDLGNHVLWSFDRDFMIGLQDCLEASWAFMDEQRRLAR